MSYCGSLIAMSDITDGTSQTYLLGREQICPDNYSQRHGCRRQRGGVDGRKRGHRPLDCNVGSKPVARLVSTADAGYAGLYGLHIFGSAHAVGFNMAICDGSVRMINYSIDPETHRRLGNRKDGYAIDTKQY